MTLRYNADGADVDGNGAPDVGTDSDAITVRIADVTDPTVAPFEQTFSATRAGAEFDIDTLLGPTLAISALPAPPAG